MGIGSVIYYIIHFEELRSIIQWYLATDKKSAFFAKMYLGRHGMMLHIHEFRRKKPLHCGFASSSSIRQAAASASSFKNFTPNS